jgi:glutamate racemase
MDAPLQNRCLAPRTKTACIGVFDSGVGGLSVLRSLHAQLPHAPLLYVADSAHAPYGERSDDYVLDRSRRIMDHLLAEGAIGLVIACNTATAIAIAHLREANEGFPIVGVEPGLKPAVAATRNGRIGVMATPATIASAKFRALVQAQGGGVHIVAQPCPGLARLIEEGDLQSTRLRDAVEHHTEALRVAGVDTVVLGCTHYPFVRNLIEAAMGPGVEIVDTADAVARRAVQLLGARLPPKAIPGAVRLQTTGDASRLRSISSAWLPFACEVEEMSSATPT